MRVVECLLYIVYEVECAFKAAGKAHEVTRNACRDEFVVGELTVCGTCRVQTATARVGNVGFDSGKL